MMKRYLAATVAAAALALPLGSAPALATHTLCDNETTDTWFGPAEFGADTDDAITQGTVYVCHGYQLLVIRAGGPITYCDYFDWHNPSTADCTTFG